MALDPSISLGVKTPETSNYLAPVEQGMKLAALGMQPELIQQQIAASRQQVAASKSAQALTEAQTPGAAADSAIRKRAADFAKWQTENASKYTNADGTPNIDMFVNHASRSGYFTEAQAVAASDLDNKSKIALNATNDQERAIKQSDYLKASLGHVATLLDAAPESKKAALLAQYAQFADSKVPGTGAQLLQAFGKPDPKTGVTSVDTDKVAAFKKATMTPLEAGNLAVSQMNAATSAESVRQGGIVNVSGPEARNPNSVQSQQARAFAIQAGIAGVTENMSAADIANLPGYKEAVAASVVPAAVKGEAVRGAVSGAQAANTYLSAKGAVDKLVQRGILKGSSTLGTFIEQNKERLANDPDFRAAQAALNEITRLNPAINPSTVSADALSAQLNQEANLALKQAKTAGQVAPATTFNQAVAPQTNQPVEPNAPAVQKYKPGQIVDGRPVLTPEQAAKMPKGFKFKDTDGVNRTRN